MRKMSVFAHRCTKELMRDPLAVSFSIGFPAVVMLLLTIIQRNIPAKLFELDSLTPGMCVFGLSFISLFSAQLIAKDRESALIDRLFTTPMTAADFILGYTLPLLPMAVAQCAVCFVLAMILGLKFSFGILLTMAAMIPVSFTFIGLGLLCGSVFNDKQVGGLCGALLTNLTAWLSGAWFDLELVGGAFKKIAFALPFANGVEIGRGILQHNTTNLAAEFAVVLAWGLVLIVVAVSVFRHKMKN